MYISTLYKLEQITPANFTNILYSRHLHLVSQYSVKQHAHRGRRNSGSLTVEERHGVTSEAITNLSFSTSAPPHGVYHRIPTRGHPVWSHPCHLIPEKSAVAGHKFAHLHRLGITQSCHSKWALPLHMAPKANSEWQP